MRPRYLPSPPAGYAMELHRKPSLLVRAGRAFVDVLASIFESTCR